MNSMINCDGIAKAKFVKDFHAKIEKRVEQFIEKANNRKIQKVFDEGDLVWVHLRKKRFSNLRKSKLLPRGDGPFKIIKRINDNAYILDMPPSYEGTLDLNLWTNSFKGEPGKYLDSQLEDTQEAKDHQTYIGLVTRGKLKRLQQVLQIVKTIRSLDNSSPCPSLLLYITYSSSKREVVVHRRIHHPKKSSSSKGHT
ncbi:hypothetical protein CR513_26101, partial [Mucuna pruriens]